MRTFKDIRLEREAKEAKQLNKLRKCRDNPKDCPICKTAENFKFTYSTSPGHGDFTSNGRIECSGCGLAVEGQSNYGYQSEMNELEAWSRLRYVITKLNR